jgi:hypothetical protein
VQTTHRSAQSLFEKRRIQRVTLKHGSLKQHNSRDLAQDQACRSNHCHSLKPCDAVWLMAEEHEELRFCSCVAH